MYVCLLAKKRPGSEDWNYGCKKSRERRERQKKLKVWKGLEFFAKKYAKEKITFVQSYNYNSLNKPKVEKPFRP